MPQPQTPICPKCGYDQSGEIATWSTQCPTTGTCPECGYTFAWADVTNPSRIQLPWYVEHAKSKRHLLKRTLPTLWILLFPNRYFRRLTMETPRSIKSYLLWLTLLMLILHILSTAALIAANFGYHYQSNASIAQRMPAVPSAEQQILATWITDFSSINYWKPIIGEALLFPIIQRSAFEQGISQVMAGTATACLGISIMWLILYSAFPVTRKRTKLRMAHITRAMIVAGFLPMLTFEIGRILEAIIFADNFLKPTFFFASSIIYSTIFVLILWMIIWTQWFWIAATRIGWQIKAKWWELVLLTIASFLGMPIAGLIMTAFKPIRIAIEHFAIWIGI